MRLRQTKPPLVSTACHILMTSSGEIAKFAGSLGLATGGGLAIKAIKTGEFEVFKIGAECVQVAVLVTVAAAMAILTYLTLVLQLMCSHAWQCRYGDVIVSRSEASRLLGSVFRARRETPHFWLGDLPFNNRILMANVVLLGGEIGRHDAFGAELLDQLRRQGRRVIVFDPNARLVGSVARHVDDVVFDLGNLHSGAWDAFGEGMQPDLLVRFLKEVAPKGKVTTASIMIVAAVYSHFQTKRIQPTPSSIASVVKRDDELFKAILADYHLSTEVPAEVVAHTGRLLCALEAAERGPKSTIEEWARSPAQVLILSMQDGRERARLEAMLGLAITKASTARPENPPVVLLLSGPNFSACLMPSLQEISALHAPVVLLSPQMSDLYRIGHSAGLSEVFKAFGTQIFLPPAKADDAASLAIHLGAMVVANFEQAQKAFWRDIFPRVGKLPPPPPPKTVYDLVTTAPEIAIVRYPAPHKQRPWPVVEVRLVESTLASDAGWRTEDGPVFEPPPEPITLSPPAPPPPPAAPPAPPQPDYASPDFLADLQNVLGPLFGQELQAPTALPPPEVEGNHDA